MASFPLWAAITTIKSKVGTWVGYEIAREADPNLTRQAWGTAIGQARAALANRIGEVTRPLNRRPVAGEITPYASRTATGFMQYVDVYTRDRDTGVVSPTPFAIRTDTLYSRQKVLTMALARYEAAALPDGTFEGEIIVGAAYAGTVEFIPMEEG